MNQEICLSCAALGWRLRSRAWPETTQTLPA